MPAMRTHGLEKIAKLPPATPPQKRQGENSKTPIPQNFKKGDPAYIHSVLHTRLAKFKTAPHPL